MVSRMRGRFHQSCMSFSVTIRLHISNNSDFDISDIIEIQNWIDLMVLSTCKLYFGQRLIARSQNWSQMCEIRLSCPVRPSWWVLCISKQ